MKVAFYTLGCKVNQYETESIKETFQKSQYEVIDFNGSADIYIVNTCTVTNVADKKSRQMIQKAKKQNPQALVVVIGCYAQKKEATILEELGVDLVLGNTKKNQVLETVELYLEDHQSRFLVENMNDVTAYEPMWLSDVSEKTRAYLKIQDGCNAYCAYCIIPYVRGRIRSRAFDQILEEVRLLALKGYKEVVLTGIHLASYEDHHLRLIDLLEALEQVEGLTRIRLGSLEPKLITEEFVRRLSKLSKICPHFHLSLQSGCDRTLKSMNRKYTTKEYKIAVDMLKEIFPKVGLTTDVIVGFPGESEMDFKETKAFIESIGFSTLHVFKYSIRAGTKAATMADQIDPSIKDQRSKTLINLSHLMETAYVERCIGDVVSVLIEGTHLLEEQEYYIGHTKTYLKVWIRSEDVTIEENNEYHIQLLEQKDGKIYGGLV